MTDADLALSILRKMALDDTGAKAFGSERSAANEDGSGIAYIDCGWTVLTGDELDLLDRLTAEAEAAGP